MKKMTSAELRAAFLAFFAQRGHSIQPSSSLVPGNDPTLLFTNAGMVQFKDVFLGREHRSFTKAATSQRCVRAGGKHNDLENVGYTARHHTFFEMLGNFSFGDYFKKEAIYYAWEFLTKEMGIPVEKLWVTVYAEDHEAEAIWLDEVGISPERFSRIATKDNFWSMGDVGPCGPCTEIFYDHGEHIFGGPPGSPDEDGDRYIEIWNLVFMQYDRSADGTMTPLPKPSVDTGMGLERIAAILQGVHSNYETDLFQKLLNAAAQLANTDDLANSSLRVIADHIRSCAFLITDGVMPSNEGRGYVLRRIIRRALRHGYRLGIQEVFFHKLVAPLVAEMGDAYPELKAAQAQVERVLKKEEERFAETLGQGMKLLEACVAKLDGTVIPGDTVFQLYDTYGFPVDLTADFAREHNLTVDYDGFDTAMAAQRDRARSASHFGADYDQDIKLDSETEFTGYELLDDDVHIIALYKLGQPVDSLQAGDEGVVILDKTPFYAESGGQAGDCGELKAGEAVFAVSDTQKQGGTLFLHKGKVAGGVLHVGQLCNAKVSAAQRNATELNHSATHLLHAALRQTLGDHVAQKGSLVNPERLRFDFSHFEPVTPAQMATLEKLVNAQIRLNNPVSAQVMAKDDAVKAGAMALFGEKYGDQVRVLKIGDFSTELCGGTHVERAGDIGCFKIISETGVAAGVRRIEAVTGAACLDWLANRERVLAHIAALLKSAPDKAAEKVEQLLAKNRDLEKQLERLNSKLASSQGGELTAQAVDVAGAKVLAVKLDGIEAKALRDMLDQLKNKLGSCAVVLAVVEGDKVSLIAGVSKDLNDRVKAGDLVNFVALQVGGKGGGRPDMAMAGGTHPAGLAEALAGVVGWVEGRLV
jgi:alanyl-tRNA synthetase